MAAIIPESKLKSTARSSAFSTLRSVVFTDNNPVSCQPEWPDYVRYAVWQLEAAKTGTKHLQGYLEFKYPVHFSTLKKLLPRAHFEKRFGTREQARDYCMKADTRVDGPWEHGDWISMGRVRKYDASTVLSAIKSGAGSSELLEKFPRFWFRHREALEKAILMYDRPRTHRTRLHVIFGDRMSGKTRYALQMVPDAFWAHLRPSFDGYDGCRPLVFDNFDVLKLNRHDLGLLNRLADRTPMRLAVKYSSVEMRATDIFVIGDIDPKFWAKNIPDQFIEAFLRRIDTQLELRFLDSETIRHTFHEFFVDASKLRSEAPSEPFGPCSKRPLLVDPRRIKTIQVRDVAVNSDFTDMPPYVQTFPVLPT